MDSLSTAWKPAHSRFNSDASTVGFTDAESAQAFAKDPLSVVDEAHTDTNYPDIKVGDATKFYSDAYTHGYTEGYIAGYEKPAIPKPPAQIPIAIVGMSTRLPGNVNSPDEFWELCSRARNVWSEIPKERFENAAFHHPNPGKSGCFNAKGGHFLKEDVGLFDAPFFSLTAQEAISMDPQQRILLECTFEALDSAGFPKHEVVGKDMGVFIGGSFSEYEAQLFSDTDTNPMYQSTGCAFAMQSNRISHFFDLRGPSFTMDTACSSSLVALHQACQALRNGECSSAIVGGCHLNMAPEFWISMSQSRLFSDQGRSFSFDSRGTGYGRGEGCGMVILKPLDQAIKDNDNIRSVIVASGINQDGKTPGITMPNGTAQEELMRSVYSIGGIDPKETGYVEAHGTGTKVGDPIEATALYNVFGEGRTARNPLFIGSIKSNIGHLEAASGIMSVIKAAMMLERGFILPNFDFKKPNEKIPFAKWNLKVPISQRPWPRNKKYASVNNFGFGGTNAHVVLEKAPLQIEQATANSDAGGQGKKLFVLSANDKVTLESIMKNIGIYLEQRPEFFQNGLLDNVAYTLGQRRSLLQWRVAIPASSSFDLLEALNNGKTVPLRETEPLRIGFIFTGQGAQWNAMGRELYDQYPVFAATIDACTEYLKSLDAPFSLFDELNKDAATSLINEAQISQPACTAIQLALTDLLQSWGISPVAVTGHSSGEISAAYAAGILPLQAAMAASYYRGLATIELRKNFPDLKGSMMAVGCTKEEIEPLIAQLLNKNLRIACYNSPTSLTISGDTEAIDELQIIMEQKQMFNRKLLIDVAYHSHHMELVAENYRKALATLDSPTSTHTKFYSSLFGKAIDGSELQPSYWVDNLTQSVRFSEALTSMCEPTENFKTGVNMLIELGPSSALAGPVKQILKAGGANAMKIPYASALVRKRDAVETALELASTLFVRGATLAMGAINIPKKQPTLLVDMPRYPWNHQTKYWHESRIMQKHKNRPAPRNDLLGTLANYSNDLEPTWRNILRIDDVPWLRHHKIQSLTLFPMSGFIAMAVEAIAQKSALRNTSYDTFELRNISVNNPLMVTDEEIEMTLQLRPHQEGTHASSDTWDEFKIHSWAANKGWTEHCKGFIAVKSKGIATASVRSTIDQIAKSEKVPVNTTSMYDSLTELGVEYGPTFRGINSGEANDTCSIANITVIDTAQEMPQGFETGMIAHPAFIEQLIEMYWPVLGAGRTSVNTVYLSSSIERMTLSRNIEAMTKLPGSSLTAFCQRVSAPSSRPKPIHMSMFATATPASSQPVIVLDGLTISPIIESEMSTEDDGHRELCYKLDWEPILETEEPCQDSTSFSNLPFAIIHGDSESQMSLTSALTASLEESTGQKPISGSLLDIETDGKLCLFISELEKPLLSTLTPTQFSSLQRLLTSAQGVLWVVRGAYVNSSSPDLNMVTGLSRSIRSETLLKFATLDLDAETSLDQTSTSNSIIRVLKSTFSAQSEANCELEFMERKGRFFTPRIINDDNLNEYVSKQQNASRLEPTPFKQEDRPLKMQIGKAGALDTLHFVDQPAQDDLANDEIEIEIKAIGMNARDIATAMGQHETLEFGSECSGIITRIGSDVTYLSVGNRVSAVSPSGSGVFSTFTRVKADFAFQVSDNVSFETAASVPMAFCAAHYGLIDLGRLQPDESVLIQGASTAAGQAAISLARMIGADISVTVETEEGRTLVRDIFDFPEGNIFGSDEESIRQMAQKQKFDVILNCASTDSDTLRAIWSSLNSFGRFVELDNSGGMRLETSLLENNRSFLSVDLTSLIDERPKVVRRLLSNIAGLWKDRKISSKISVITFPISDVETAFKVLQSGNVGGKVIISPQPGDTVKATPSSKGDRILRSDASYILIGGTGGLGRSMARWMVSKGARNLVLVSRSASATGKVQELIEELTALGATIAVKQCDVANQESVENLINNELYDMPEIRGVIHGAMVLKDVLFEKMEYSQYTTVIESKVSGAWNFHNALLNKPTPLDFFVTISSAAGAVGNRGQAAYSAANTFLNAFVQHRLSLSLPASSIDLTAVSDVGYLAENAEAAAEVSKNLGSDTICEAEVLALLGAAINGTLAATCSNHTITGMRITPTAQPFWTPDAKFKHLRLASEAEAALSSTASSSTVVSYHAALKASQTAEEAQAVICQGLLSKLPSVLMLEAEDMDVTRSLSNYALDSLVAIEVRNYITREFEANLQVLELLSSGSIEMLAKTICVKSKLVAF